MTTEAEQLANELTEPAECFPEPTRLESAAAALLRSQAAEIERLREILARLKQSATGATMKPSKELCEQWTGELLDKGVLDIVSLCELAAAWGEQQSLDGKRWAQLWGMVDAGDASVVIYGLVDSINTGLEINDGGSLTDEVDAAMKGEQQ